MLLLPGATTNNTTAHAGHMQIETDVVEIALALCGMTSQVTVDAVKAEGLVSLSDFAHLFTEKQVGQFAEMIRTRHNGASLTYMNTRKLRGLSFWVRKRCLETLKIESLTPAVLDEVCRELESAHRMERMIPSRVKNVEIDIGLGWFQLKNRILHKLRTMTSAVGGNVSLSYVLRPGRDRQERGPWNQEDYTISIRNQYFPADNKAVALFLADLLMDTSVYSLVRDALDNNDGREAWIQLVEEAESEGRAKQRYKHVSNQVAELRYNGREAEFPFHEYAAKMRRYFDILEENGRHHRFENYEKIFIFLDQMQLSQQVLREAKTTILQNDDKLNFEQCVQKMSKLIAENRPLLTQKNNRPNGGNNRQKKRRRRS